MVRLLEQSHLTLRQMILFALLCALLISLPLSSTQSSTIMNQTSAELNVTELQRLFQTPPDDARIMMRWWWFGPAVTKAEIGREMRLMKAGGIGGFEVQPVYPLALDDERRHIKTLPFLSDGFIDALRFTAEKARELGLRFDLTLGSGWPYGGPMVSVSEAASRLRVERVKLALNMRRVPVPNIGAGEKLLAVFLARPLEKGIAPDGVTELTDIKDGAVRLPDGLESPVEIQFFIASRTGMQVKRPAVGAEGFVLDHLDRAGVDNYLKKVGDRLMQAFDNQPPYAIFCDSLEVYNSDWAGDFLEEFHKRRGYDLRPVLPALVNDMGAKSLAIRRDWGKTLTELLNERFLAAMRQWSQRHHTRFRIQGYGVPAAALSSNAYADLAEGEGPQWKNLSATRWAASASHLYGQPVTSSETWTWLHSPAFRATPLDVKAEADRHFLQGINQLIGHGWPYTAEGVEYPGWRFYAAGVFNEKNPWWIVMPDMSRYLQRLSFLLRQGRPANDVAIYLPNDDAWARFTNGNVSLIDALRERLGPNLIPRVLEAGYNFDFFDDDSFKQAGGVENGALILGENQYKVVILPSVERIRPETLQKLEAFARGGGVLLATRRTPFEAPGFQATAADHQKVAELSRRLFAGAAAAGHFVADENEQLNNVLTRLLNPDVQLSPAAPEIGFIHRRSSETEIYFLANTDNAPHKTMAAFRVAGLEPEWWDPLTGDIQPAIIAQRDAKTITVALDLAPYESRVLVFARRAPSSPASVSSRGERQASASVTGAPQAPIDLSANWQVTFGESVATKMETLRSWTDDESTRYYSGPVAYEKTFNLPDDFLRAGVRIRLDFGAGKPVAPPPNPRANGMQALLDGPVREAAVVMVNGRRAGAVWCPPFAIAVTEFLRRGENHLRIVVANTAINYMAGRALPDYRLLNLRYGERFQPQDMDKVQPVTSGLLGPIRLIATVK
jgi:hypothetical protein